MRRLIECLDVSNYAAPPHESWHVRNLVREAVTFAVDEVDDRFGEVAHSPYQTQLATFRAFLAAIYPSKLVVKVREFDRLPLLVDQSRYIVLVGPRGGGKTTIITETARRLRATVGDDVCDLGLPASSVYVVDLARHGQRLRYRDASGTTRRNVCELLYDVLRDSLFSMVPTESSQELVARWNRYKLTNSAPFAALRREILEERGPEAAADVLFAQEHYPDQWRAANQAFTALEFEGKFEVLLEFVSALRHRPIFLIDNIDRYSRRLHELLNERVQHLANRGLNVRFVVAFRGSSFRSLRRNNHIDGSTTLVEVLGPDDGRIEMVMDEDQELPVHNGGIDRGEGFDDHLHVQLTNTVYRAILTRRLTACHQFLETDPDRLEADYGWPASAEDRRRLLEVREALDSSLGRELEALGHRSFLSYEREVVRLLQQNMDSYSTVDPRTTFLRWHNFSIRSALAHHFDELSYAISGYDPLFEHPIGLGMADAKRVSEHDYRSMLWRHLVISRTPAGEVSLNFDVFTPERSTEFPVYFPRLKLLQLLCAHGELDLGTVKARMQNIGFPSSTTCTALKAMRQSRGYESGGFVRLDCSDEIEVSQADDSTLVRVRPSGRYFLSYIVPSCEYLFWCAMNTEFGDDWRRSRISAVSDEGSDFTITRELVASDAFRARLAADFLRGWVLPRYGIEAAMDNRSAERAQAQVGHFSSDFSPRETASTWFLPTLFANRLVGFERRSGEGRDPEIRKYLLSTAALCSRRFSLLEQASWWPRADG